MAYLLLVKLDVNLKYRYLIVKRAYEYINDFELDYYMPILSFI